MKGRLGSNEHREKYRCDAVLMDAPANPVGSSEDRLLLQSEGKRTRSLYFMTSSHSEPFTRGGDMTLGEVVLFSSCSSQSGLTVETTF